jgi:hypothetical protein
MDATTASDKAWRHCLDRAAQLGAEDAGKGDKQNRTGKELARALCSRWTHGHAGFLRAAYSAARWHAEYRAEKAEKASQKVG